MVMYAHFRLAITVEARSFCRSHGAKYQKVLTSITTTAEQSLCLGESGLGPWVAIFLTCIPASPISTPKVGY